MKPILMSLVCGLLPVTATAQNLLGGTLGAKNAPVAMQQAMPMVPMVDPAQPQSVADALQKLGFRATLERDSDGDPKVRSAIEGINYSIWFYGCDNSGAACTSWNFSVGFDLTNGTSAAVTNEWNQTKLVGRAYLDSDMDPYLDYFVEAKGGMSDELFERVVERWGVAIADFKKAIDW